MFWTDETPIKVGQKRGQVWVTRKKNEAWHKDCINLSFKKYTNLQFWGCFTAEFRGPYHIYGRETASEKAAAKADLQGINANYNADQQLLADNFHTERANKPQSKRLKRVPKPEGSLKTRRKDGKGGIDWYHYRTEVLRPKLIPFCR